MFVIVVGGGNTGSQLAKFLLEAGHVVRVIDERPNILKSLATDLSRLPKGGTISDSYKKKFMVAVNQDLDTPVALSLIFEILKDPNIAPPDKRTTILYFDSFFGLKFF